MTLSLPKTRWARTIDGAWIAYQDFGDGPITLVMILAWVSHLEVYWEQPRYARFMRRLSRSMRVLTFDKRGMGMSDRMTGVPDLETRVDDVRAVMDAAGVERAAMVSWANYGPELAVMFAATYPERTLALVLDGPVHIRKEPDYPWGITDIEQVEALTRLVEIWGDDEHSREFIPYAFGDAPGDAPIDDPEFLSWCSKFARFAATPGGYEAFERVWFETNVRHVLPALHVPTIVRYKTGWGPEDEAEARYAAGLVPGARVEAVEGVAGVPWIEEPEAYVCGIERFLESIRREEVELDRVLATVLFTDVVGSTEKAATAGDREWCELVDRHHTTVRAMLARYRGTEIKTMGDGFLATFDGPARAVKCAQGICEAVKPLGLEVRAGCHTGEIELTGADVGGIAVHIGARVGALAGPSEVLVSSTVKDLVAGSGLVFEDRGEHELKGVPEPWRLYAVTTS
jgi:class 3 adenylate cyclase